MGKVTYYPPRDSTDWSKYAVPVDKETEIVSYYKKISGKAKWIPEECKWHGKLNVDGLVVYVGNTSNELQEDFKVAVEDYLQIIKELYGPK